LVDVVVTLLLILTVVTLVGHGIWVLLARIFGWLGGSSTASRPQPLTVDLESPSNGQDALRRLRARLGKLAQERILDAPTAERLMKAIDSEAQALRMAEEARAAPAAGSVAVDELVFQPVALEQAPLTSTESSIAAPVVARAPSGRSAKERARAYAASRDAADAEAVEDAAGESLPPAPRRRAAFSDLLMAFMQEKNIRWGELVGGLLIIGSSVALVISFWAQIAARPWLKFGLFNGVTAALFGVGLYTDRKWKIHTTSRGLLIISTLLVPLNFLAIAAFTQDSPASDLLSLAGESFSVFAFSCLIYLAARIIAPDARVALTIGVMVPSLAQLLVRRWAGPALPESGQFALAAAPVACYLASMTVPLRRYWKSAAAGGSLSEECAQRVFTLLGVLSAAMFLPLALLAAKLTSIEAAIQRLSPVWVWCSAPAVLVGLLFWRYLADRRLSGTQTAGLAVGVLGALVIGTAMFMAWPEPARLLPVAVTVAAMFSWIALGFGIPFAHVPAGLAVSMAWVIAFHLLRGEIPWKLTEYEPFQQAVFSLASGNALVPIVALFGAVAWLYVQLKRPADAQMMAAVAGITSVFSLALVGRFGFGQVGDPGGAFWTLSGYAVAAIAVAWLANRRWLTWLAWALVLAAIVQGVVYRYGSIAELELPWVAAMLTHATLALAARAMARPRDEVRRKFGAETVHAAAFSMAASAALLGPRLFAVPAATAAIYLGWLGLLLVAAAMLLRHGTLLVVSQAVILSAVFAAVVSAVETSGWYVASARPWLDPWFLEAQGLAIAAYCVVITMLVAGWKRLAKTVRDGWRWEAYFSRVEQIAVAAVAVLFVAIACYAAAPGVMQELTPVGTPRGDGPAVRLVPPLEMFELAGVSHAHAAGRGAWALAAGVTAALAAGMWRGRNRRGRMFGMIVVLAAICPLLASTWEAEVAVASALRWITAGFFVVASIPLWLRRLPMWEGKKRMRVLQESRDLVVALACLPYIAMGAYVVQAAVQRAGIPSATALWPQLVLFGCVVALVAAAIPSVMERLGRARTPQVSVGRSNSRDRAIAVRNALFVLAFAPAGMLLAFTVAAVLNQYPLVGPEPGSWFRRIGWDASYGAPLMVIAAALVAHAVRDRSSPFAFAAGLLCNVAATLVVMVRIVRGGGLLDATSWIVTAQANAIVMGVIAVIWLAANEWWRRKRASSGELQPRPTLLRTQAILAGGVCASFLLPAAVKLSINPVQFGWASAADGAAGWMALVLAIAAGCWSAGLKSISQVGIALAASGVVVLIGLTATRWDTGNWQAYYALMFAACAAQWLVPPVAVSLRWLAGGNRVGLQPGWSSIEIRLIALLTVALAVGAMDANPLAPWATVWVLMLTGCRNVWIAWSERRGEPLWIAGLLFNLAASIWWIDRGHALTGTTGFGQVVEFVYLNVLAAAPTAMASAFLARERSARTEAEKPPAGLGFHRFVAWGAATALLLTTAAGLMTDLAASPVAVNQTMGWIAWLAAVAVTVACWWDERTRFPVAALYSIGLVGVGVYLDGLDFQKPMFHWALANALAAYSLAAAYLWSRRAEIRDALVRRRVPAAAAASTQPARVALLGSEGGGHAWLVSAGVTLAVAVLFLVAWIETVMSEFSMRMIAAYAIGAEGLALGLLARGAVRTPLQYAALVFGALFGVAFGWAWLPPDFPAAWLHRGVATAAALALATVIYGLGLVKLLRRENEWTRAAARLVPELIFVAAALVFVVLASEVAAFAADGLVPIVWSARVAVLVALAMMTAAALAAALLLGRDPLGLSERGRTAYVYAAEVLLVLAFVHVRVTIPWLFHGWYRPYWPLVMMAIAFVGTGFGEFFDRRQERVLGGPLGTTGALLPVLPACGFWLVSSEVHYSLLLLSIGALYAGLSALRKSFIYSSLAALAMNGSVWYLLYTQEGLGIAEHPQLWLIPPALCVLVAGYLNRERLSAEQSAALRYASAIVIYASSTADIFINGVAEAPWLPAVLAALSIAGIFAGIAMQVRAFLYLGTSFLVVAISTVIWHAAIERQRTWILWMAGIVTGALIIALFGIFEKRRDDVLRMVDRLKQWEA
jgi:hypothetical protein